jgi:uncharacterized protein YdaU (DUF1376 family)
MIDWYKFNFRDYRNETFGLPDAEDLAYRRLIDLYYTQEGPLPAGKDLLERMVALDYDCIEPVLKLFFRRLPDGRWTNDRLDQDLARRKAQAEQARTAGKRGGRPKAVVV